MTPNLRTVFRPLLDELGIPETEYWEIERVDRMANLFEAGRTGPGGGTPATPQAVVMIVISLLGGPTKRDGARNARLYTQLEYYGPSDDPDLDRILAGKPTSVPLDDGGRLYFSTKPTSGATCELTGAKTFGEALTNLLLSPLRSSRVVEVGIVHNLQMARIIYLPESPARTNPTLFISYFGAGETRQNINLLATTTTIRNPFFAHLARRFASADGDVTADATDESSPRRIIENKPPPRLIKDLSKLRRV